MAYKLAQNQAANISLRCQLSLISVSDNIESEIHARAKFGDRAKPRIFVRPFPVSSPYVFFARSLIRLLAV